MVGKIIIGVLVLCVFVLRVFIARQDPHHGAVTEIPSTGNIAHDHLMAMSEAEQASILVPDDCVGDRAFYMGMDKRDHSAQWSVGCTNGKSYGVMIHADAKGSSRIIDCSALKLIHIDCFAKLSDQ